MQQMLYIAATVLGLEVIVGGALIIAFPGRPERNTVGWATGHRFEGDAQSRVEGAFAAGPFGGQR